MDTPDEVLGATAQRIVDAVPYMTLATADEEGRPWASPVWFARESPTELLWVSVPDARHSQNIAARPEVAIVIFDSTVPIGQAEAVYFDAVAGEVPASDRERAIAVFAARSKQAGGGGWTPEDVSPPARLRLYRAVAVAQFVLGPGDRRIPVPLDEP